MRRPGGELAGMQRLHDFVYGVLDHVWTAIGELAGFILVLIGCACCFYV